MLLEISGLKVYYTDIDKRDIKAVDGINLKIDYNEIAGLVGESGCGKSTVALSIMQLIQNPPGRIVDGRIFFKGKDLLSLTEEEMNKIRGKELSMIFQDPKNFLNPVIKVKDQITEIIMLHQNKSKKKAEFMTKEVLRRVNIPSPEIVGKYYPHQLSGGMAQRVLIGIGIASSPSLLIADEPTTAVDMTIQAQILRLLRNLKESMDMSGLLITHDLGIVAELVDNLNIMYAGKIVEAGDIYDIFEDPIHPYTQALLKCALSITKYSKVITSIPGTVPDLINPPHGCRFHPRCPYARPICSVEEPREIEVKKKHLLACWLYD